MKFIAEIGLNHNGNFELNYELIRQAKNSGADIAKFQLGWRGNETEMNFLDKERLKILESWCKYFEIEFMVSIFTEEAFNLSQNIDFDRFKIASRTVVDNISLVKKIVNQGKPTYISLGMWNQSTLPLTGYDNIHYLWCKSKYPTTPWDLIDLPKEFNESPFIGYSDHSIGIDTALLAISRGAKVIEKHFTLDKSNVTIRDHALSATPEEFRNLTLIGREIHKKLMLGV